MKKYLLLLLLTGCAHVNVSHIEDKFDEKGKLIARETIKGKATFLLSKGEASKVVLGKQTKTTSQLFGADKMEESGDAETIKAIEQLLGSVAVKAMTNGIK